MSGLQRMIQQGVQQGIQQGEKRGEKQTVMKLIKAGIITKAQAEKALKSE